MATEHEVLTEEQWMKTAEYVGGFDWGNDIYETRPVLVMWHDPSETPSEAVARLNGEAIENANLAGDWKTRALAAEETLAKLRAVLEA